MQLDFFDIPSPCVGVCQSDEKGYCLGCMRSRDERLNWLTFDNTKKQKVIKLCIQRQKRKKNKAQNQVVEKQKLQENEQQEESRQPSLLDPPSKIQTEQSSDLDFGDFEL